jgi:hypothetical protein
MRFLAVFLLTILPLAATAGLAEWEIKTPGGNFISHTDPWIAKHATCLRTGEKIQVSHLEWWRYHPNAVIAGKARQSFFLFDEAIRVVALFPDAERLEAALSSRRIGPPVAAAMTPADGWRQVWGPILEKRCKELGAASASPADGDRLQAACGEILKSLRP